MPVAAAANGDSEDQRKQTGPEQIGNAGDACIGALQPALLGFANKAAHQGMDAGLSRPHSASSGIPSQKPAPVRAKSERQKTSDAKREPKHQRRALADPLVTGPTTAPCTMMDATPTPAIVKPTVRSSQP